MAQAVPLLHVVDILDAPVNFRSSSAISAESRASLDGHPEHLLVTTAGSLVNVLSGAGIYLPLLDAQYPVRPPDYTLAQSCNSI